MANTFLELPLPPLSSEESTSESESESVAWRLRCLRFFSDLRRFSLRRRLSLRRRRLPLLLSESLLE